MSAGREPVKGHGGGNTSAPIIGIDLGTTFSVVAIAGWPHASDPARVLSGADGRELIPSVVRLSAADASAPVIVGAEAKAAAAEHVGTTISSAKRLMGRSLAEVLAAEGIGTGAEGGEDATKGLEKATGRADAASMGGAAEVHQDVGGDLLRRDIAVRAHAGAIFRDAQPRIA
ncbi:MAG: Hsp70 family protein, partial [Planctomyces sp.]